MTYVLKVLKSFLRGKGLRTLGLNPPFQCPYLAHISGCSDRGCSTPSRCPLRQSSGSGTGAWGGLRAAGRSSGTASTGGAVGRWDAHPAAARCPAPGRTRWGALPWRPLPWPGPPETSPWVSSEKHERCSRVHPPAQHASLRTDKAPLCLSSGPSKGSAVGDPIPQTNNTSPYYCRPPVPAESPCAPGRTWQPRSSSGCSSSSLSAHSVRSPASAPAGPGDGSACATGRCSCLCSFPECLPAHGPLRAPSPLLLPSRPSLSVTRRLLQSRRTRPERFDLNMRQPRQFWMCPVGPVRVSRDATSDLHSSRRTSGVCTVRTACASRVSPRPGSPAAWEGNIQSWRRRLHSATARWPAVANSLLPQPPHWAVNPPSTVEIPHTIHRPSSELQRRVIGSKSIRNSGPETFTEFPPWSRSELPRRVRSLLHPKKLILTPVKPRRCVPAGGSDAPAAEPGDEAEVVGDSRCQNSRAEKLF